MPHVFIPTSLRPLADNQETVEVSGANVRQLIEQLEQRFPGIGQRLRDAHGLRPGLAVSINGHLATLGLLQPVPADAEVHFLPAIGGG